MVRLSWNLEQTLLKTSHPELLVMEMDEADLVNFPLDALSALSDDFLGVACTQGAKGRLTHIAFATPTHILCVRMPGLPSLSRARHGRPAATQHPRGRKILREMLLDNEDHRKLGFDMHKIALSLYYDFELTIVKAIDLQSACFGHRQSVDIFVSLLGGEAGVHKRAVHDAFIGAGFTGGGVENLALRAWAACQAGTRPASFKKLQAAALIDTTVIPKRDLHWLAKFTRISWQLYALKPTKVKNDVRADFSKQRGTLQVEQTRFKTRMRTGSGNQTLHVEFHLNNGGTTASVGRVAAVKGKAAQINVHKAIDSTATIKSITTIGKEALTSAEMERESIVLSVLQQKLFFFQQPLARKIFDPSSARRTRVPSSSDYEFHLGDRVLNESQTVAVDLIVSENPDDQIVLVHGPPGTGKTSVIAASVIDMTEEPQKTYNIWLVAQSNVAVKNIAEKLASVDFFDFKILVSVDFHFDWHEHLYTKIESNVIRSDSFADNDLGTERLLSGSKVILCTLSMLSTHRLLASGYTRLVPVETVIIDEASQIELGDYLPLLGRFGHSIKKLVFIGDDRQLAPYGQDDLGNLPSIFELQHLRQDALFLDTQYRMPAPIGRFISKHVYDNRLKTIHSTISRRSCVLIDVCHGKETKTGHSWTNRAEADAIVVVARKFHAEGKTYRVITPYDAQRNLLERRLKEAKLPWENKCFNVDSFQGNEEDYILISVVRSDKTGFLSNMRRTNVMLSRCKCGMIICTSRAFMAGKAQSSLVGKLAQEWADGWVSWRDTLQGKF
ncbi:hypothetical protein EVJ58_g5145 [Rhodofomes roseus]|uniref:DNA2/NAM7 helicase-like C-terminal domain-containing protein n=1 Tax=Rhodofomes roseus TaxID=34475 RepID=A0A4Y9YDN6_9APHY|nr:hypothetical protein EVJ58_g5145 [Rhodofomes roseus]